MRRFSQLILSVSHQGKAAAYVGVAVLRLAHRPVLRLVFSSRLYVHRSLFIRVVASKKRRRFPSPPLASCLTPSNPPPVASFASLIRLVPRPFVRLAARLVPRAVSPHRLVLISSRPVVPDVPHACRPSCRRAVLFSSSRRSPHALPPLPPLPLSSPHDRITQGGQRIPPHAPGADKHGANEQHAHRNDTDSTPPPQERLITYPQGDKTNEKKRDEQARRDGRDDTTRRRDGDAHGRRK